MNKEGNMYCKFRRPFKVTNSNCLIYKSENSGG